MTDRFSGGPLTDPQSVSILTEVKERKPRGERFKKNKKDPEERPTATAMSELYTKGLELLKASFYTVELCEGAEHINHRILRPATAPKVLGISYPSSFQPLQDISTLEDFTRIEAVFDTAESEVRDFWQPLFRPKGGDSDLGAFTERLLKMKRIQANQNIHEVLDYGQTFDPDGTLTGSTPVRNPRIWVPARKWFDPVLHSVGLEDVFTIFPHAERELLKLILGRVGVGRANHLPPGFSSPVDHTARMAAVVVGKDAGLGKSTVFNGMTAAFSKCGFNTHTFKSTEDRFGLKAAASADIAYKDDTAMKSLRAFLSAEETKILITNGLFQTEEKFQNAEQVWPRCVIIVNSNDWNANFAYELDPGIIDRIKILSTYREYEVFKNQKHLAGTASEGSPDLRPRAHIPFLAAKLGVSPEALYLWCLRLATDRFWEVITDTEDPAINRLQVEVRYWTTRQRIRFKADVTQALVNAMAFAHAIRIGAEEYEAPELTPDVLAEHLKSLYFVGVDPSCYELMNKMKKRWELAGRPSTHYYQGFRELRWESVDKCLEFFNDEVGAFSSNKTAPEVVKLIMEKIVMRDGFKIGGGMTYVVENWENMRHATGEIEEEAMFLLDQMHPQDRERLLSPSSKCYDEWLKSKNYSPDRAEKFRKAAREKLYNQGVKP
jgi:hypothetical protein